MASKHKRSRRPHWVPPTPQERLQSLIQNGITPKDLEREYNKGYKNGFSDATEPAVKTCYATLCLALKEEFGFGRERIKRALARTDQIVIETLTSAEAIDAVFDKIGLKLRFNDPFDRIEEE